MPKDNTTRDRILTVDPDAVSNVARSVRLLQSRADSQRVTQAGQHLIEQTFNDMVRNAADLELLLEQYTDSPQRTNT